MTVGDIKRIELTRSSFKDIISNSNFYVDKTRMIENFLSSSNSVHLVARQRRLGKTLNMDTLRCFLTEQGRGMTMNVPHPVLVTRTIRYSPNQMQKNDS